MENILPCSKVNIVIRFFLLLLLSFTLNTAHASTTDSFFKFTNSFFPKPVSSVVSLSEEELANLVKPSIVRVVNHAVGTTTFNIDFKIDITKLQNTARIKKTFEVPFDIELTGTGFIVTPNGNIVTNSHVVSVNKRKLARDASDLRQTIFTLLLQGSSDKDLEKFGAFASTTEGIKRLKDFGEEVEKKILDNATITSKETITVLNPLSTKDTFDDLIQDGFIAKIISVNETFKDDDKDIAIIKIEKDNLPAIPLTEQTNELTLSTGQRIYTFGFPSNADIRNKVGKNVLEPTFTSGLVNSFKDSSKKDFKLIQTDAKISTGSSGSPAVNAKGEVVGIMTLVTSIDSQSSGDSFAFAIPSQQIISVLQRANVVPETGPLYNHFIQGNQYLSEKHCALATKEFTLAQEVNTNFYTSDFITPYLEKCKTMQAGKLSIDTELDQFKINIAPWKNTIYVSTGIIFLLLIVGTFVIKRLKHDEEIMEDLEKKASIQAQPIVPPVVTPSFTAPSIPQQAPSAESSVMPLKAVPITTPPTTIQQPPIQTLPTISTIPQPTFNAPSVKAQPQVSSQNEPEKSTT